MDDVYGNQYLKACECGCGTPIPIINRHSGGQPARFKHGHNKSRLGSVGWNKGRTGVYSPETRARMSAGLKGKPKLNRRGPNHFAWMGDNASYNALHSFIRRYYPKPDSCQTCGRIMKRLELSCITGTYNRDPSNYRYLCHRCHYSFDFRYKALDTSYRNTDA